MLRCFFLGLLVFLLSSAAAGAEELGPCVKVGIATRTNDVKEQEARLGVKIDHIVKFQAVQKLSWNNMAHLLDQGVTPVLNIEFREDYANLADINNGKYDDALREFGAKAKQDGRLVWLRLLHEGNGGWYNWSVYYDKNTHQFPEDLIAAYRHVVQVLRQTGGNFKFQYNLNRYNDDKHSMVPFAAFYPGDDVVDMFLITSYNRVGTTNEHSEWSTFKWDFDGAYQQAIALTKRPIGIAEVSTTTYAGTDKPAWIRDAFKSITENYPRVTELTWFSINKTVNDILWDWDLNTPADIAAFREGVTQLREARCKAN